MIPSSVDRHVFGRTLFAALSAALVLGLGLGSCSKRVIEVDPDFVLPEGRLTSDAQLVIWRQTAVEILVYADLTEPLGPFRDPSCNDRVLPDIEDPQIGTETETFGEVGAINIAILDHTPANAFRPLRRESNGGYRAPLNFPLGPSRKWLDGQWELYSYKDTRPSGFQPPTYVARGIVSGQEGANSPLTNEGVLTQSEIGDIAYTGKCLPCDSLFTIRWARVPGAAHYWLHVFQFTTGTGDQEQLRASRPAPVNDVRPRDFLVAQVPGTDSSYKLKDASRTNVIRLVERFTNYNQTYLVRIAAVDSAGQLIAYSRGDYGHIDRGETYGIYRRGAFAIKAKRPGLPDFPFCQPE